MEGDTIARYIDLISGHGIGISAITDISHRNILITAYSKANYCITLAIIIIPDKAYTAAPFIDLAHWCLL